LYELGKKAGGSLPPSITVTVEPFYTNPSLDEIPELYTSVDIFISLPNGSSIAMTKRKKYGENAISAAIEEAWHKVNAYCEASELDALRRKMGEIHRLSACEAV